MIENNDQTNWLIKGIEFVTGIKEYTSKNLWDLTVEEFKMRILIGKSVPQSIADLTEHRTDLILLRKDSAKPDYLSYLQQEIQKEGLFFREFPINPSFYLVYNEKGKAKADEYVNLEIKIPGKNAVKKIWQYELRGYSPPDICAILNELGFTYQNLIDDATKLQLLKPAKKAIQEIIEDKSSYILALTGILFYRHQVLSSMKDVQKALNRLQGYEKPRLPAGYDRIRLDETGKVEELAIAVLKEREEELSKLGFGMDEITQLKSEEYVFVEDLHTNIFSKGLDQIQAEIGEYGKELKAIDKFIWSIPGFKKFTDEMTDRLQYLQHHRLLKKKKKQPTQAEDEQIDWFLRYFDSDQKIDLRTCFADFIVLSAKDIPWLNTIMGYYKEIMAGSPYYFATKIEHELADAVRDLYRRHQDDPTGVQINNLNRVRIYVKSEKRTYGERFNIELSNRVNLKPSEMEDKPQFDLFIAELRLQELDGRVPEGTADEFRKAFGDIDRLVKLTQERGIKKRWSVLPPNQPNISFWGIHLPKPKGKILSLFFPTIADEYQYFYSLWVKKGKQGLVTIDGRRIPREWFAGIRYLPRISSWYVHHIAQIKEWFPEFEKGEDKMIEVPSLSKNVQYLKFFDPLSLKLAIEKVMKEWRYINLRFFDDLRAGLYTLRKSLNYNPQHLVEYFTIAEMQGETSGQQNAHYQDLAKLYEPYNLTKDELIAYPPDWQPKLRAYDKAAIDEDIRQADEFAAAMLKGREIKKKPAIKEELTFEKMPLNKKYEYYKKQLLAASPEYRMLKLNASPNLIAELNSLFNNTLLQIAHYLKFTVRILTPEEKSRVTQIRQEIEKSVNTHYDYFNDLYFYWKNQFGTDHQMEKLRESGLPERIIEYEGWKSISEMYFEFRAELIAILENYETEMIRKLLIPTAKR